MMKEDMFPQNESEQHLPKVSSVNLALLKPSDFADDELDLPYYLVHLHEVANSIIEAGENRGFMGLAVWRDARDNNIYNARVMENCLPLAFFYCVKRPWNPYYSDPALKRRLETALGFWCGMQHVDGTFTEYSDFKHLWLAATAFSARCISQTLALLRGGPPLAQNVTDRLAKAGRNAVHELLRNPDFYDHGKSFANQFAAVWSATLSFLTLYPDCQLRALLEKRIQQSIEDFQSPAGYFYEMDGPDWSYNLYVHTSELHYAMHYARETDFAIMFLQKIRNWHEWLSFNAVHEPDGSGFYLNCGIATRQRLSFIEGNASSPVYHEFSDGENVESVRAFARTRNAYRLKTDEVRSQLEQEWPVIRPMTIGAPNAFDPTVFLHRGHSEWYASHEEKAAAIARLPYLVRKRFIHQRMDSRYPVIFTYICRPSYYVSFTSGPIMPVIHPYVPRPQQRYGFGFVWNRDMGTVLQPQAGTNDSVWGTARIDSKLVREADSYKANFSIDGTPVCPQPGCRDLPEGVLTVEYPLGENGYKKLTFTDDDILVIINFQGQFIERIPFLIGSSDEFDCCKGTVRLQRDGMCFTITLDKSACVVSRDTENESGPKRVVCLSLKGTNILTYKMMFATGKG